MARPDATPTGTELVDGGKVSAKPRFDKRDWETIADYIKEEKTRRARLRSDLEKQWKDIDRQLRMEPDLKRKMGEDGKLDETLSWMSELELPSQTEALEILTSDARRMMFPSAGPWFQAHVPLTDEWLRKVDMQALIAGDENDTPSVITQDNADKLIEGVLEHFHRAYDFRGHWDGFNANAFAYGTGVGRVRMVERSQFVSTARGVVAEGGRLPVFYPVPIKSTYLDDMPRAALHEGALIGPSIIQCRSQKYADLVIAANKGENDPEDPDGGWMPARLKDIEPDDKGYVELIEYEGDLVVERKSTGSLFIPGALATCAVGKGKATIVRFRWMPQGTSSYIVQPYHIEDIESPYGVGPLMKGRPIQIAATEALNAVMDSAQLLVRPPVQYDSSDPHFSVGGGPNIHPGALLATLGDIQALKLGDPAVMLDVYLALKQQYSDVTGVNAPRLGAQTVSHTTAFAKDAELQRGVVRTVDYVNSLLFNGMSRCLSLELELARKGMKTEQIYIEQYGGYVDMKRSFLPERAAFDVFGAGGPLEERQEQQAMIAGLQLAMQIDGLKLQLVPGAQPLDYETIQREILRRAGFKDVDRIAPAPQGTPATAAAGPGVPGAAGGAADPGAQAAILQSLQGGA